MRTSYNTSPFYTLEILKKYIITLPNIRVRNDKQWNLNKHLAIGARIPSEEHIWVCVILVYKNTLFFKKNCKHKCGF